ncbi:MAG: type 1 glutamine amidotransferase domain-containing protein [Spirochaetota bacterium]
MGITRKRVLSLLESDFEDMELWYPRYRLEEAGVEVVFAASKKGELYKGKYGVPAISEMQFAEVNTENFDMLLVPGGWAPDKLRRYPEVIRIVQEMNAKGAWIGQICHAGWVLVSADILRGRKVTSTPGIKDDMTNAGAEWLDEAVVVDANLISSRRPPDLPEYGKCLVDSLS